jgi:hypothetical protein
MARKRAKASKVVPLHRSCATMAVTCSRWRSSRRSAPQFKLEQDTARRRSLAVSPKKAAASTVKVVVNVVYKTDEQNISDAQIKSQIAVLNRDFSAKNPDKSKVPAVWKGLVTDSKIRFKLFKVTRTKTSVASFQADDAVKRA